ncbi:MAG TPA: hypothetical protein VJU80_11495, partial [Solirubrobacteraceae bacterium]|nr:hypothetical protein [Solirubrobacteraceae bacterium]
MLSCGAGPAAGAENARRRGTTVGRDPRAELPTVQSCAMLDLEAYLDRIGLSGRPGLAELHR